MTKLGSKLALIAICVSVAAGAKEYHVSVTGNDNNNGTRSDPFRTISHAAMIALPGDEIIVHAGIYREKVIPARGGESDSDRIAYRSAGDGKTEIRGSEIITGWIRFSGDAWKVTIPNSFFGKYNPYKELIYGDWFSDYLNRRPHTGEVYLNGKSLFETNLIEDVLNPRPINVAQDKEGSTYTWYCESDELNTYIYANFHNHDPNKELVEINVRESCFYPDSTGCNFITVTGFEMSQAATQWAAPTAEQVGLIGTNWSKGWIIENNIIHDSKCSGITLGKDRKTGQNVWLADPCKGGDVHYNEVIVKALGEGWSKDKIGSHMVRNNTIYNCEQTGMCGSLGAVFSQIVNNNIYNIWTKRLFTGAEIAGIKIHASIDLLIKNNRLANVGRGLWMDWMAQGTHITCNLCYNNTLEDLYCEVDHGPYLVDNNIFLSEISLRDWSEGGAFVNNLFTGRIVRSPDSRTTPYHKPHSTQVVALKNLRGGDNRFFNNIFIEGYPPVTVTADRNTQRRTGYGLEIYNNAELPMFVDGNIYYKGAKPFKGEANFISNEGYDPMIRINEDGKEVFLIFTLDKSIKSLKNRIVTTQDLGKAIVPGQAYENPDETPLRIDTDYSGSKRNEKKPTAGPFENPVTGKEMKLKVW
ncbi:MAG: DUF1565 domain-containing protein [Bacteroidota bacterium]|nr:DUF1565 domain-containing protein [Bacteroidota bacterium]